MDPKLKAKTTLFTIKLPPAEQELSKFIQLVCNDTFENHRLKMAKIIGTKMHICFILIEIYHSHSSHTELLEQGEYLLLNRNIEWDLLDAIAVHVNHLFQPTNATQWAVHNSDLFSCNKCRMKNLSDPLWIHTGSQANFSQQESSIFSRIIANILLTTPSRHTLKYGNHSFILQTLVVFTAGEEKYMAYIYKPTFLPALFKLLKFTMF